MIEYVVAAVVGLVLGALGARLMARGDAAAVDRLRREADEAVERARIEAETTARKEAEALRDAARAEVEERRKALEKQEERVRKREELAESREADFSRQDGQLARREKDLARQERRLQRQEEEMGQTLAEAQQRIEAASGLSREEARALLMDELREDARRQSVDRIRAIEEEARRLADERARMIVGAAIQRYASEHVTERTVSTVPLPNDDLKGRIIGKEGRNIRAFESATGCDLIVDDTPGAVVVSGFNPVRREVARVALLRLVADGRIHPTRIEEVVERARSEVDAIVRKHGEEAALELEVSGLHPELIKALGRLAFVTGFAQNVLRHSIEVGFLAGAMAAELGLDVKQARRAGLLHDVGKAVDHEAEGSTVEVGAALCRKHGESKAIVQAIAEHMEAGPNSVLGQLIAAANRLSADRPGARREALAGHIKRLEALEKLVGSFDGVERCFVIQAGQEVSVIVDNARVSDRDAELLARDAAQRISEEHGDLGQVRVTVIRQTRAVHYAR
ncbi:MAG: ribonuclease Y [bacterium]